jgi:hypothetical protein
MKGTFFQKPLEFNVKIEGESWRQGDGVAVTVSVKNHGSEALDLSSIGAYLAFGGLKKVRERSPKAFEVLAKSTPLSGSLAPQKEFTFSHLFSTDRNCPITDNSKSLFLVYGQGSELEKLGMLQLAFHPFPLIEEFLNVFQTSFRFVRKAQCSVKKGVEIKLGPPTSKVFAALEGLVLIFRFDGENLEIHYTFNTKALEATAASVDMKKKKTQFSRVYTPDIYLRPSGRFDHERIEPAIREDLEKTSLFNF